METNLLRRLLWLVPTVLLFSGAAAQNHHNNPENRVSGPDPVIENSWARATPGKAPNGAVYMRIANHGTVADRLVAAASEVADKTEIHTHVNDDGILRMRRVSGLNLPPGRTVELEPGGYHLMLMGLHAPLEKGHGFTLELVFERAGRRTVEVRVLGVGAMGVGHEPAGSDSHH